MYLSNRDIKWAIEQRLLVVDPPPDLERDGFDETSIDLHLDDTAKGARVWDVERFVADNAVSGMTEPELHLGRFNYKQFAGRHLTQVPREGQCPPSSLVFARESAVIVRPGGFVLWTTRERVGTPEANPQYICFVNAKSTRARTGVVVHLSAPTIHAGWVGNITLEIANFGPFHLVLKPGDAIAQLTVATISSPPDLNLKLGASATAGQIDPSAASHRR